MLPSVFAKLAHETASWCDANFDPARPRESLRSAEMRPLEYARDGEQRTSDSIDSVEAYERIANARRTLLTQRGIAVRSSLFDGRLLVTDLNINLSHGFGEECTGGFFNVGDLGPWDSWVAKIDSFLVSWVPKSLIEMTERELIQTDPVESIGWVDHFPSSSGWPSIWNRISVVVS